MKKQIVMLGLFFCILTGNSQDYFPIVSGSYWVYDVYQDGINSYQDSTVYNTSVDINDTTFHLFIHNYIENGSVTMKDTFFIFDHYTDDNTLMLSNRNMPVVDSAIYAKHNYADGEWWIYYKIPENDTIYVEFIDNYTVSSGSFSDCFLQGDEYIFAPDVGIIKIKLWNEESYYDLKSYFIPQETSVAINKQEGFEIYPNPAYDYVYLKNLQHGYYQIYDVTGQVVKGGDYTDSKIHVAELSKGLYIISIDNDRFTGGIKFIKD